MKLHKQSSGVGKYLKWVKEKLTGGNLPNINQQPQEDMPCKKIHKCKVDPETRIRYCTSFHFGCYI